MGAAFLVSASLRSGSHTCGSGQEGYPGKRRLASFVVKALINIRLLRYLVSAVEAIVDS